MKLHIHTKNGPTLACVPRVYPQQPLAPLSLLDSSCSSHVLPFPLSSLPTCHNAGLAPTSDANAFINRRSKELNNGRLAMLAWAGMVVQELVTNSKIFS